MNLNHFLPSAEQLKKHPRAAWKALRSVLWLLGSGWAAAPVRRLVQLVALASFVTLILVTAWPRGDEAVTVRIEEKGGPGVATLLRLDPLAFIAAAVAGRSVPVSLAWAAGILAVCLVIPRGFCSHVCPLGTLIDLFDWAVGRRFRRLHLKRRGWWVHLRYYLLAGGLAAAALGLTLVGLVAAIPLVTRGAIAIMGPLQLGLTSGWDAVPPVAPTQWLAVGLLAAVLLVGLLGPRFWCRCLCPTGAVFSMANLLRLTDRKVTSACIRCGKCIRACPFDAVKDDFSTQAADCTFCQDCGGVCPTAAITFVGRWSRAEETPVETAPALPGEVRLSRRSLLAGALAGAAAVALTSSVTGRPLGRPADKYPIRPPGSVPEDEFLGLCVRCGNCIQVCPSQVLRPAGLALGLESLWTPHAQSDWAGCREDCNNCGQACPTGAIRRLPLEEKRAAHMGRAAVNVKTCLPHSGRQDCGQCMQRCMAAGYEAIELRQVRAELSADGQPVEGTGFWAPFVLAEKCVGCGQCQEVCYHMNHLELGLLAASAIAVEAGPGKDDRLFRGSYIALREAERRRSEPAQPASGAL